MKKTVKVRTDYVPKARRLQNSLSQQRSSASQQTTTDGPSLAASTLADSVPSSRTNVLGLLLGKRKTQQTVLRQKCPLCNQLIPLAELDKHIKVELLDPRFKEQQQREQDKKRQSNLLLERGTMVAENLNRLAEFRPDIFGGNEEDTARKLMEKKRMAIEKEKKSWDGTQGGVNRAMNEGINQMANFVPEVIPDPALNIGPTLATKEEARATKKARTE